MENKRLSDNFWLKEYFISNDVAPEYALILFNNCSQHQEDMFYAMAQVQQKVRDYAHTKIGDARITNESGYRDAILNGKIPGASKTSLHTRNLSVDFRMTDKKNNYILPTLWGWMKSNVPVGELYLYETEDGRFTNIHYSRPTIGVENRIAHKVRTKDGLINKAEYEVT